MRKSGVAVSVGAAVAIAVAGLFLYREYQLSERPARLSDAPELSAPPAVAEAAAQAVAEKYPQFEIAQTRPIMRDQGDTWKIEYKLPNGTIGGTPVVVIDKETLRIRHIYHTQ